MLNTIVIQGRLARDPELRRTGSGIAVANFTVAVDRDFSGKNGADKEVDFIDCVAWRQTGEFVSKYFTRGRMIVVSGRLQITKWEKDGKSGRKAEVVADSVYFGDSKRDGDSVPSTAGDYSQSQYGQPRQDYQYPYPGQNTQSPGDFAIMEDDDGQLPF